MSDIVYTVKPERITEYPGSIRITYDFELPNHLTSLSVIFVDGWSKIRTRGFEVNGQACEWGDANTRNPSIEIIYGVNDGSGATSYVDTGKWAITRLPNIQWRWKYSSFQNSPDLVERQQVPGEGAISTDGAVAYLGPHKEYSEAASNTGEEFRLIVPHDANLTDKPSAILSALVQASELLDIGALNGSVLAIAAPTDNQNWTSKGRQRGDSGFWVREDAVTDEANETWVHEYVHTRQLFKRTDETYWFTEGTADYFAALAALARGDIGFSLFHSFLTRRPQQSAVLAYPDTWFSTSTAYRRGRRTCGALDWQIKDATGGSKTLMNVVARLNEDAEPDDQPDPSNEMIRRAINRVSGLDLEDWFEDHVYGSDVPPLPDKQDAYLQGLQAQISDPEICPDPGTRLEPETEPVPEPGPEPESHTDPAPDPEPEPSPQHQCPICDTKTQAQFCPSCGNEFDGSAIADSESDGPNTCPTCGTETDERFCPTCGREFDVGVSPPDEGGTTTERRCPVCDTETSDALCPTCGHDMAPRCPVCDAIGGPEDEYCETCGQELLP